MQVSERSGWVKHGSPLQLEEIPKIDLAVVASVAVAPSGARLGKARDDSKEINLGSKMSTKAS